MSSFDPNGIMPYVGSLIAKAFVITLAIGVVIALIVSLITI